MSNLNFFDDINSKLRGTTGPKCKQIKLDNGNSGFDLDASESNINDDDIQDEADESDPDDDLEGIMGVDFEKIMQSERIHEVVQSAIY